MCSNDLRSTFLLYLMWDELCTEKIVFQFLIPLKLVILVGFIVSSFFYECFYLCISNDVDYFCWEILLTFVLICFTLNDPLYLINLSFV